MDWTTKELGRNTLRICFWLSDMVRYAVYFVLFISSLLGAYLLGRSHSELKIVKEQIEVVKYVNKETAKIHAQPNASREQLLDLMKKNML